MEPIPDEAIEIYHNFCEAESVEQYKVFLDEIDLTQLPLDDYAYKTQKALVALKKDAAMNMMFCVVMRCYKYYNLPIPAISKKSIEYKDSIWKQRIRSHRDASKEDLIAYLKTEIRQPFLIDYIFELLTEEEIKDTNEVNICFIKEPEYLLKMIHS